MPTASTARTKRATRIGSSRQDARVRGTAEARCALGPGAVLLVGCMASMVAAGEVAAREPTAAANEPPRTDIEWAPGMGPSSEAPADPMLVIERSALVPGETAHLGITFEIEPGWHTYWPGQNGTGYGVSIDWDLPDGLIADDPIWPAPRRYYDEPTGLLDHVYEGRVTLIVPVRVDPDLGNGLKPGQRLEIGADLDWLVCEKACIPGRATVSLEVDVAGSGSSVEPSEWAPWFEQARERVPDPLPGYAGEMVLSRERGSRVPTIELNAGRMIATFPGAESMAFYPHEDGVRIADLVETGTANGARIELPMESDESADPGVQETRLMGVFEVEYPGRDRPALWWVDTPLSDLMRPPGGR